MLTAIKSWFRTTARKGRTIRKSTSRALELTQLEARENPTSMYNLTWLGTAQTGENYSDASAINDLGQVVGTSGVQHPGTTNGWTNAIGPYEAFSWTAAGGMVSLGTLNGSESYASAVNNNGEIVGTYNYYTIPYQVNGGGYYEWAWYGQQGQMQTIPGHNQIGGHSRAQGINDAGVIVGVADPTGLGFRYDGTTFSTLSALGGRWSQGVDINNAGWVAGFADTGANPSTQPGVYTSYYHAAIWSPNGTITDIGTLGLDSYATKINETGMVVGYSVTMDPTLGYNQYHPFLYDGHTMVDIGVTLAGNGFANSINNLGQIVGGSGNPSTNQAWLYESGSMYNLANLINGGLSTDSFSDAKDINNLGQIVGTGMHNGHTEAFLLTPSGQYAPPAPQAPQAPAFTITGGIFTYDGTAHQATGNATDASGVSVNGSYTFTYNGSTTPPVDAGTYAIAATFVSADPNFTNATASGTLTITPATPSIIVTGGTYSYNGASHPATATATGVNAANVNGLFTFTYNGSTTPPADTGNFAVVATFTSNNPNYSNATGNGSITITQATPTFSNLSAPTITAGTASTTITGKLAAGATPVTGSSVSVTLNGVTQNTTVDATGSFSTNFATNALTAGNYSIGFAFAGNANFAAATGSSQLTVNAITTTPPTTTTSPGDPAIKTKEAKFWYSTSGITLLQSFNGGVTHTELATWLATNFSNLYGANAGANNLTGKTNADVVSLYQRLWRSVGDGASTQVLTTALNVYATTASLGGAQAANYGFRVSAGGQGSKSFNVKSYGAAVGVANNTTVNVLELLRAVNSRAVNGVLYNGNPTLTSQAKSLFDSLNTI